MNIDEETTQGKIKTWSFKTGGLLVLDQGKWKSGLLIEVVTRSGLTVY